MGKGALVAGAALLVLGGGALGYGVTRKAVGGMTPEMTSAMGSAVASLDGDIRAARASVEQRAKTLADVNTLRATIGTDKATVEDMLGKEIAFKTDKDEVIELGQIPAGGEPLPLTILPAGATHMGTMGKPGGAAELIGDTLYVTQTVAVTPADAEMAKTITGFVTVSKGLDLSPAFDRLTKAGLVGRLEVGEKKREFGGAAGATAKLMPAEIPSQPGARLLAVEPPVAGGMPLPVVGGGAAAAGLGLILVLVGLMTGRDRSGNTTSFPAGSASASSISPSSTMAASDASMGSSSLTNLGPGAQIGRWQVVRRLGSGGMADVYLCQSRGEAGFEKLVALKLMHQHLARNQRAVDHFLDEARLASRITHANVVAIQDLGKIGNDYVIVMEYVEGVDLERILISAREAQRLVPLNIALGVLTRICDGLSAAHNATSPDGAPLRLIHRDVKAANVLVSKQGGVKVMDFGIAKAATQAHMTVVGETKGTPSMMAPEQRVGEQVDVRADVYSAGAVAYEILTGHGVNLDLAALAHLGVEKWPHLPPPSSLRADLPPELDAIVLLAMAFERERRPADMAAFEHQLEQVMRAHSLTASDKDIARWAQSELAQLGFVPTTPSGSMANAPTAG